MRSIRVPLELTVRLVADAGAVEVLTVLRSLFADGPMTEVCLMSLMSLMKRSWSSAKSPLVGFAVDVKSFFILKLRRLWSGSVKEHGNREL